MITMKSDKVLKQHLLDVLDGDSAHLKFDDAVKNISFELQGKTPKGVEHSAWQLLEHIRIAMWDILEFTRDPKHVSPEFPAGYWPASPVPPDEKSWERSAAAFRADRKAMSELIVKDTTDVLAPIPHAKDKTILRELLVAADHNAYHLGQLVSLRRLLGAWQ
jgi:hypothetical protein